MVSISLSVGHVVKKQLGSQDIVRTAGREWWEGSKMTKAEAMFDKLGYEVMPPVSQTQCQVQSEDRDTIIDIEVTKWRGHDGKYLKLTKDEIEACIQVIREMGEKYET